MTSSSNFSAAAGFVAYPTDLHLNSTSPCVDAGITTGAPADDMDGQPRSPTLPDVGADEWGDQGGPCLGVTCSGHGTCQVVSAEARCLCNQGYQNPPGNLVACTNINECATNNGGCDPLTVCTDTDGGRTCGACPPGYSGSGESGCTPSSCSANPCQHGGTCSDVSGGGYSCSCVFGTSGTNCEITLTQITSGDFHNCGISSNLSLGCWFKSGSALPVPSGTFLAVEAGPDHRSCGLRSDSTLACWTDNGSLLTDTPSGTFIDVAAGVTYNKCGVRTDGTVTCWGGTNDFGEATPPSGTFKSVAVSLYHSCGIQSDDSIDCWGADSFGESTPPTGTFSAVDVGWNYGCGLRTNGTVTCWGRDDDGQSSGYPTGTVTALATGQDFACAVLGTGALYCWGDNTFGKANPPSGTFNLVSASSSFACGVRTTGAHTCWGI
jgi:hypothetical protein